MQAGQESCITVPSTHGRCAGPGCGALDCLPFQGVARRSGIQVFITHLERVPQRTRSSRCSSLPPPSIVGTGAADQGQQRCHSPPRSPLHVADGRNQLLAFLGTLGSNGVYSSETIGRRGAHRPIRKNPISTAILNIDMYTYIHIYIYTYIYMRDCSTPSWIIWQI
jgi:hypothetical protein